MFWLQAKTIIQAEIDSTCELIDFLNFNVQFGWQNTRYQPISEGTITNTMSYRGMEGFWASIAPFNFTAIGGNLSSAPAIAVSGKLLNATPSLNPFPPPSSLLATELSHSALATELSLYPIVL